VVGIHDLVADVEIQINTIHKRHLGGRGSSGEERCLYCKHIIPKWD
jgi:hypothetical protein